MKRRRTEIPFEENRISVSEIDKLLSNFNAQERVAILNILSSVPSLLQIENFAAISRIFEIVNKKLESTSKTNHSIKQEEGNPPSLIKNESTDREDAVILQSESTSSSQERNEEGELICILHDVSFSTPRKKLNIEFLEHSVRFRHSSGKVESTLPYSSIQYVFFLLSPLNPQQCMLLFYSSSKFSRSPYVGDNSIVATIVTDTEIKMTNLHPNYSHLSQTKDGSLIPTPEYWENFVSIVMKKNLLSLKSHVFKSSSQKPFVPCYNKAKDGFLYFLNEGIIFGFKKPIFYIPSEDLRNLKIHPVSRNFELELDVAKTSPILFSMLPNDEMEKITLVLQSKIKKNRKNQSEQAVKQEVIEIKSPENVVSPPENKPVTVTQHVQNLNDKDKSSEEEDEDYNPSDHEAIPEDFDENYKPPSEYEDKTSDQEGEYEEEEEEEEEEF